ncbi:MAG: phosphoglycerate mutase family protein, partial [Paracoccaceae bacterium]
MLNTHLYPELYILRHGETLWNQQGRFQGQRDSPLTDKGRRQAMAQGKVLR